MMRTRQFECVMAAIRAVAGSHAVLMPSLTSKVITVAEDLSVTIEVSAPESEATQAKLSG